MKQYLAELVGTFILVLFGCGTAVVAGDKVGIVGIAFAFGFGLIAAAYGIGPISGCHINPAVSLGVWTAGRMSAKDLVGYWIGQAFWRRGITSEALARVTAWAWANRPELMRLYAPIFAWNEGSQAVARKCGYFLEAQLRCSAIKDGRVIDRVQYAALRSR